MGRVEIVMRSYNDMPLIEETLAAVAQQDQAYRLISMDNASQDGTQEAIQAVADHCIEVPAGSYVPGRVLNDGMKATEGDIVVFLNSDCTPQNERWLSELIAPFDDPQVAATFGRQIAREDCWPAYVKDTEECYGDGAAHARFHHVFSMASSAVRRSVWEQLPFDENLGYSEDVDWSWRARAAGHRMEYAPGSVVAHSHNYTLKQLWKRQYGEGRAEAAIFDWPQWRRSLLRYTVLPYGRQLLRDWSWFARHGAWGSALKAPLHRGVQHLARRRGFLEGMRDQEDRKCA